MLWLYCFDAVHVPLQPSDRLNVPEPLLPEKRPELLQLKPDTDPPDVVEPFGLTEPELSSPEILPLLIVKRSVLPPQPWDCATHAPSKLPPPPPPLFRAARRGSSGSALGLLRRAGFSVSTARGVARDPDSDFSSLPMLPPALPDCAKAALVPNAAEISSESRAIFNEPCRIEP
jgi:hypothetical protein